MDRIVVTDDEFDVFDSISVSGCRQHEDGATMEQGLSLEQTRLNALTAEHKVVQEELATTLGQKKALEETEARLQADNTALQTENKSRGEQLAAIQEAFSPLQLPPAPPRSDSFDPRTWRHSVSMERSLAVNVTGTLPGASMRGRARVYAAPETLDPIDPEKRKLSSAKGDRPAEVEDTKRVRKLPQYHGDDDMLDLVSSQTTIQYD